MKRTLLAAALLALAACSPAADKVLSVGMKGWEAKDAGDAAVDSINGTDERAVGQAAAINVISTYDGLVLDDGLMRYVNEVGNLVAQQGTRKARRRNGSVRIESRRVFVAVLDHPSRNAFSLPGGYILVTRGLLESLQTESELAWVLGHEIAHADYEDGLIALKGQFKAGGMAQSLAGTKLDLKDSAVFKKIADAVANHIVKTGWDVEAETRADKWGLDYATKAGYDGNGAQRVLGVLASEEAAAGTKSDDKSHLSPQQRYDALAKLIAVSQGGAMVASRYDSECLKRLESWTLAKASGG